MGTYLTTIAIIFAVLSGGILIDRLYRGFAARNPQLGPFRDNSKCGSCSAGSGCSDVPSTSDSAATDAAPLTTHFRSD